MSKKTWNDVTTEILNNGAVFNKKKLDGKRLRISKDGSATLEFEVALCYATGDLYLKHVFPLVVSMFLDISVNSAKVFASHGWKYEVFCKPEKVDKLFKQNKKKK